MAESGEKVCSRRILCIDDDAHFASLLKCAVERIGHSVTTFADAALALDALDRAPAAWDLVITDFQMPGTDGLEVARHLGRHHPKLPFAVISHHITDAMARAAAGAGVRVLLHKPVGLAQFADLIERAI